MISSSEPQSPKLSNCTLIKYHCKVKYRICNFIHNLPYFNERVIKTLHEQFWNRSLEKSTALIWWAQKAIRWEKLCTEKSFFVICIILCLFFHFFVLRCLLIWGFFLDLNLKSIFTPLVERLDDTFLGVDYSSIGLGATFHSFCKQFFFSEIWRKCQLRLDFLPFSSLLLLLQFISLKEVFSGTSFFFAWDDFFQLS